MSIKKISIKCPHCGTKNYFTNTQLLFQYPRQEECYKCEGKITVPSKLQIAGKKMDNRNASILQRKTKSKTIT